MSKENKTIRVLSDINFENKGAHLALCHKDQGVANGADYALVLKAENFSKEFIEKIQQVQVTMELPDFLTRFFYLWEEDAEVLASMMGYVEQEDESMESQDMMQEWVKSRMTSFEILKSAKNGDYVEVLKSLNEDQYLAILQDQEMIEKAFSKIDAQESIKKAKTKGKRINKSTNKEKLMTKEVIEEVVEVEMIKKSEFDEIQKSFNSQKEMLEKALDELNKFKIEKQEAINKARKDSLKEVLSDEKVEGIFKALESASDESFAEVVSVMKSFKEQVEKSNLFKEAGASTEEDNTIEKSPLEKALHARLNKTSN